VTVDEARAALNWVQRSVEADTLLNLNVADLQERYDSLCKARNPLVGFGHPMQHIDALLQILRQEMDTKLAAERDERRHTQEMKQGSDILFWTKRAVAAVVVPILVALIAEIPFSRLLLATASQASPTSRRSSPTPETTTAPVAVELQSATPQASPTPSETETPIKLPPPAP
jgi:hypothetical protein